MYGGSAYSYANDPDFMFISTSERFWQEVIDKFYKKYNGLYNWHKSLIQEVTKTGRIVMPTGRIYTYERDYKGEWPQTTIKNYPVQGLGADIMSIIRVSFFNKFKKANINGLIVNTVHDSIVIDVEKSELTKCSDLFHATFKDLPKNFEKLFKVPFNIPLTCEVLYGDNMKELVEV